MDHTVEQFLDAARRQDWEEAKLLDVSSGSGMKPLIVAYALIGTFIVAERLLRRGDAARSLKAEASDEGTTRLIGAAYGYALNAGLLAPVLSRRGIARLPDRGVARLGLLMMLVGLAVRVWAALTLGTFYTRTLRVASDQHVVSNGPYRVVRHPGYAADLLLWLGFGVSSGNALVALTISLAMAVAYTRRILVEERMLLEKLGDAYRAYMHHTWRIVPLLY